MHVGEQMRLQEETLALQHQGNKSWGTLDPSAVAAGYGALVAAGKAPYQAFRPLAKSSQFLFFSILQVSESDATCVGQT